MIGSAAHLFAALLPRPTYDRLYGSGPDMMLAGVSQPAGTAEATEGVGESTGGGPSPADAFMPTGWPASA